jgi:mannose-1-phosphate guanylyltransferase
MNTNNFVVIMAGGVGSRFWPFSRTDFPKQFHDVLGTGKSLLQQTVDRFANICPKENIYIITNASYKDLVLGQLPFMKEEQVLLEVVGKNTAPCIAYAAYKIRTKNDHIIMKDLEYERRLNIALAESAEKDVLVTLGIKPSRPDTGYGYIRFEEGRTEAHHVLNFTEKPQLEIAKAFVSSGEYVWNAGIFIFRASTIINAFEKFEPTLAQEFADGINKYYTPEEQEFVDGVYHKTKNISIDYAVMERAENVFVVLSDIGWSDLGTWKSLYEIKDKDEDNNVLDGNIITYDTKDCIIKTPSERLVVTQGLEGYIVAEYDNVLMICKKEEEQKVKQFVTDLKDKDAKEFV